MAAERDQILRGARAAISAHGPEVTIGEIADHAAVHKPAIYRHFRDKAGLAEALATEVSAALEAAQPPMGPQEELRAGIEAFTHFVTEETNLYRFLVRSMKAADDDVFELGFLAAFQTKTAQRLGAALPHLTPEVLDTVTYGLLGQTFAATEGWLLHRRGSLDEVVDTIITMFTQGVVGLSQP